jgi:hypothetical protein
MKVMYRPGSRRNSTTLWALIAVALLYTALLVARHGLTGSARVDAGVGVLLGLFICSRPAANMLDIILFGRYTYVPTTRAANLYWLALNILVLAIGLFITMTGTTRLAAGPS